MTSSYPLGREVTAYCYGEFRRVVIDRVFPGSTWIQVKPLEAPHRIPIVIPMHDIRTDGPEELECSPQSP